MNRKWMRLDNAALIFPAIRSRVWVNTFRISMELTETVDPALLQQAVRDLAPRFPSLYVRLGRGLFWYFLEQVKKLPQVRPEYAFPLTHMSAAEQKRCCFRVLYHENRIAVEFFHVLTDGSGGLVYVKTLVSRYLELKYGINVTPEKGVLDYKAQPADWETEDAFQRTSGKYAMSRREETAYRLSGTREPGGERHIITGIVPTGKLLEAARACGTTVTGYLSAVMLETLAEMQACHVREARRRPVKITVPINLRKVFGTDTMRNFTLALNIGVDPRLKDYRVEDLCWEYDRQMALEMAPEKMAARVAANVNLQRLMSIRLVPLFLKNRIMRLVYNSVGEKKGCINISNLGRVDLPEEMKPFVARVDFVIGTQASYPNNCSVASYGEVTCINMIRNIRETELERRFFTRLVKRGIPVYIEEGTPDRKED